MSKLILFSSYTNSAAHIGNYLDYMSSKGVAASTDGTTTTERQKELIKLLEQDSYNKQQLELLESYQKYKDNPSKEFASKFLTDALEVIDIETLSTTAYLDYITNRHGSRGLFSTGGIVDYKTEMKKLKNFNGNVYMQVLAIKKEDALRIGFDNPEAWQLALEKKMPEIAQAMKIPLHRLEWNGAFHESKTHPHVHLMIWDKENKAYQSVHTLEKIKSIVMNEVYSEDMNLLKTELSNSKKEFYEKAQQQIAKQILGNTRRNNNLIEKMVVLSEKLENIEGKKQYGYLQYELKKEINSLVYHFLNDKEIKMSFDNYLENYKEIVEMYNQKNDLIEQKVKGYRNEIINPKKVNTNKSLHNMVIKMLEDTQNIDVLKRMQTYNNESHNIQKQYYINRLAWIMKHQDKNSVNAIKNNFLSPIDTIDITKPIKYESLHLTQSEMNILNFKVTEKQQMLEIYDRAVQTLLPLDEENPVYVKSLNRKEEHLLRKMTNTLELKNRREVELIEMSLSAAIKEKYLLASNEDETYNDLFNEIADYNLYSLKEFSEEQKEKFEMLLEKITQDTSYLENDVMAYLTKKMNRDFINQVADNKLENFIEKNKEQYFKKFYQGEYTKLPHYELMTAINNFKEFRKYSHDQQSYLQQQQAELLQHFLTEVTFDMTKKLDFDSKSTDSDEYTKQLVHFLDKNSKLTLTEQKILAHKSELTRITDNLQVVMKAYTVAGTKKDEIKNISMRLLEKTPIRLNENRIFLTEKEKETIFSTANEKLASKLKVKDHFETQIKLTQAENKQLENITSKQMLDTWKEVNTRVDLKEIISSSVATIYENALTEENIFSETLQMMSNEQMYSYKQLDESQKELVHNFLEQIVESIPKLKNDINSYLQQYMKKDYLSVKRNESFDEFLENNQQDYLNKFYKGEYSKLMHHEVVSAINNFREHQKEFDLKKHIVLVGDLLKHNVSLDLSKHIYTDYKTDVMQTSKQLAICHEQFAIFGMNNANLTLIEQKILAHKSELTRITDNLRVVMKAHTIVGADSSEINDISMRLLEKASIKLNESRKFLTTAEKESIFNDALKKLTQEVMVKERYDNPLKLNFKESKILEGLTGKTMNQAWKDNYFVDRSINNVFNTLLNTLLKIGQQMNRQGNQEQQGNRPNRRPKSKKEKDNELGIRY